MLLGGRRRSALIEQAVSDVHLEHRYNSVVGEPSPEYEPGGGRLSSGERRRLQVAALLLSRPHVVLLDEPTTGAPPPPPPRAATPPFQGSPGNSLLSIHQPV